MPYVGEAGGGRTNDLPSRTYRQVLGRALANWIGGARGPAALPSRASSSYPPAPPNMVRPGVPLPFGPQDVTRRAAAIAVAKYSPGNQNLGQADNTYDHASIAWSRPFFPNTAGLLGYMPPVPQPSWTADGPGYPLKPSVPVPSGLKRIASATVNEEFGSSRILFKFFPRDVIQDPGTLQGRRWWAQAKTRNPQQNSLSTWALAPSYGSTTQKLATAPGQLATQNSGMGSY